MQHLWYNIIRKMRSKQALFWVLTFPIFLGFVFYAMFSNLASEEQFSEVAVGIVEVEENETFVDMMKEVEMEENLNMFEVSEYNDKESAEAALKAEEIYAYIIVEGEELSMTIRKMDIYTSLVKSFVDQYKQNYTLIENVIEEHPEQAAALVENLFAGEFAEIKEIPLKGQDKDVYTQYFYSLIAMTCLMASMYGMGSGVDLQADTSTLGARRNVAPTFKMKQFLSDFLSDWITHCILTFIVLLVLVYGYGQDFGSNMPLILLGTWIGSFVGLAAGFFIATWTKGSRSKKDGLCTAFFMISSFLGGLQMAELPHILEQSCPIVNRINPATLIVNAFSSLALFGDHQQYALNVITLFAIGVVLLVLSILKLRRTKYASL